MRTSLAPRRPGDRRVRFGALLGIAAAGALVATVATGVGSVQRLGSAPAIDLTSTVINDCKPGATFDPDDFPGHPVLDNRMLPLIPGTRSVLSGKVFDENGTSHKHEIVDVVTNVVKPIFGIKTVVLFEVDYQDGKLQESELAFQAQDNDGTLWNIGEYPEEYEKGKLAGAPSTWLAGHSDAHPGINMPRHPRTTDAPYLQGTARSIQFRDCAKTTKLHQHQCVKLGCYHQVMVSDEWSPWSPADGHQLKYYAPNVGTIRVFPVGGDSREELQLTSRRTLTPSELQTYDNAVLKQDRRGFRISRIYSHTRHAWIDPTL